MRIKNDIAVFERVVQSITKSPKKHSYIQVIDSSCREQKNKKQASRFKEITTYVTSILSSQATLEDKKRIAHSFEAILDPFVKKKKFIHYIFIFPWIIKHKQITKARATLAEFNAMHGISKSENGKLKEKNQKIEKNLESESLFVQRHLALSTLNKSPLGAYVVWKDDLDNYQFFQKKKNAPLSEKDLSDSITISSNQDLEKELHQLLSQQANLEKKVFEDLKSATQELGVSTSYAFFYQATTNGKTLHFIQKVPGQEICDSSSILVDPNENLFKIIEKQTSEEQRLSLLQKNNVKIYFSKFGRLLSKKEAFFLDCPPSPQAITAYYKNKEKQIERQNPRIDLFLELEWLINKSNNLRTIASLKKQNIFKSKFEALPALNKGKVGTYVVWEENLQEYGFFRKKDDQKLHSIDGFIRISKQQNLAHAIKRQLPPEAQVDIESQKSKLKKTEWYYKNSLKAAISLNSSKLGAFAVWKTETGYCFYQKKDMGLDPLKLNLSAKKIPFDQDLMTVVAELTSRTGVLEQFKQEGKCFEDYEKAAEHLGTTTSYAFFYEKGENLHFVQKVPGVPLNECKPIAIPTTTNLFAFLEDQVSQKNRSELLERHQILNCKDFKDLLTYREKLKESGDWYIDSNWPHRSGVVYLDEFKLITTQHISPADDLFLEIDRCLKEVDRKAKNYKEYDLCEHIFSSDTDVIAYLKEQPAGQYGIVKNNKKLGSPIGLFIRMPGKIITFPISIENLINDVTLYSSNIGLMSLLEAQKKTAKDRQDAEEKLRTQSTNYVVWEEGNTYKLLLKRSPTKEISLDASRNLFAQLEDHLGNFDTYPQFARDKQEVQRKLLENPKIGAFIFRANWQHVYKVYLRVSEKQVEKFFLKEEKLAILDEEPIQQLWSLLKRAGYAFDSIKKAAKKLLGFQGKYLLWKENDLVRFVPVCRGLTSGALTSQAINTDSLEDFQANLEKALKSSTDQVYQWLQQSKLVVENEQQAKERLLLMPLGSYLTWKDGDLLYFLQKLHSQGPILNKPIVLSEKNPLEMLYTLNSKEAEQDWLRTHPWLIESNEKISIAPGDYQIIRNGTDYMLSCKRPIEENIVSVSIDPREGIWSQFENLTSRQAHIQSLQKLKGIWFENGEQARKNCAYRLKFCCWPSDDNLVMISIRTVEGDKIFPIFPHENLTRKIVDYLKEPVSNHELLIKYKTEFFKAIDEDYPSEKITGASLYSCVDYYRQQSRRFHTDKSGDNQKINVLNDAKDRLIANLSHLFHTPVVFNHDILGSLDQVKI